MKYALFAGPHYYPGGGWDDFIAVYDNLHDALAVGRSKRRNTLDYGIQTWEWWHVVNLDTLERTRTD